MVRNVLCVAGFGVLVPTVIGFVRLVDVVGEWACPVAGAGRHLAVHDAVEHSRRSLVPFRDRRDVRTVPQPAR